MLPVPMAIPMTDNNSARRDVKYSGSLPSFIVFCLARILEWLKFLCVVVLSIVECQIRVKDSGIQGGKGHLESFAVDINFQKL